MPLIQPIVTNVKIVKHPYQINKFGIGVIQKSQK
jgi:hypothetical protein